ncbi:MAG: phage holin family protein [Desulfosarcina sp.]|nr:phage holin family protein [Desulfosarcina sp.]MBC2744724.1 phage holin family protein [Desulfosarcina sp.]MBC2767633.1 phage holin family protein [Desulfosarcina sp.]
MKGIAVRWLFLTFAIFMAAYLIDGIRISGFPSAVLAAAVVGVLNAFLRPILLILTLPLNILTLGLFTFAINAALLMMASGVISGFDVDGFGPALLGALFISVVSWLLTAFISKRGTVQYIDLKHKGGNRWE